MRLKFKKLCSQGMHLFVINNIFPSAFSYKTFFFYKMNIFFASRIILSSVIKFKTEIKISPRTIYLECPAHGLRTVLMRPISFFRYF